jgi:5-methylcytosine-specific restriction protein A
VNIDDSRVTTKPIDLKPQADLSRKYGPGIIYSLYYSADNLPPEETLISDFQYMMQIYRNLYEIYSFSSAPQQSKSNDSADNFCEEDNTKVKAHLSYERDRGISKKVKEVQGYACQCCGIDFEKKYGKIGASCVDAHHLTPVSQAKGKKVKRDLKKDFAVLCATCHRLIHRLEDTSDIENLKKVFFKK